MPGVVTPGGLVQAVVAAEGGAEAEVGTPDVGVETGAGAAGAVDGDAAVLGVVVSGATVSPVVVENPVVEGTGAGVGAATVLRSVGCLVVPVVDTTAGGVALAAVVAVVLVDGRTVATVTGRGVGSPGDNVVSGALAVISEVVEVAAGDAALVVVAEAVATGDHDGVEVVVAVVEAGRVVSTTTGQRVVETGGAPVETVVSATPHTGGGVTNFLLVVAGSSALETPAGDVVVAAAVSPGVPEVVTGVDETGGRDGPVVDVTRTLV